MSPIDLDALESVVRAAVPLCGKPVQILGRDTGCPCALACDHEGDHLGPHHPDAQASLSQAFRATFDPPTCLALVAEVRLLREALARAWTQNHIEDHSENDHGPEDCMPPALRPDRKLGEP